MRARIVYTSTIVSCFVAGNVCLHNGFLFKTNNGIMVMSYSREVPNEKLTFNKINSGLIITLLRFRVRKTHKVLKLSEV